MLVPQAFNGLSLALMLAMQSRCALARHPCTCTGTGTGTWYAEVRGHHERATCNQPENSILWP